MNAESFVAQVEDLSAPAPSVVRLLDLLNQEQIDNSAVVAVVRHDAVLCAKLLALANSAFFGAPRPIESCDEAVFYLGHDQVYRLALAVGLGGLMNRKAAGYAMDEGEFWRHSLLTARAAELLVRASPGMQTEPAIGYTAGLLHDLGKLALNQFLAPQTQETLVRRIEERGEAGIAVERAVLGATHAEVGASLLQKWNLPREIVDAVEFHHAPAATAPPKLSAVVAVADSAAHISASGSSGLDPALQNSILEALGMDQPAFEEVLGAASEALAQIEAMGELH